MMCEFLSINYVLTISWSSAQLLPSAILIFTLLKLCFPQFPQPLHLISPESGWFPHKKKLFYDPLTVSKGTVYQKGIVVQICWCHRQDE